jgi:hypothetical protein
VTALRSLRGLAKRFRRGDRIIDGLQMSRFRKKIRDVGSYSKLLPGVYRLQRVVMDPKPKAENDRVPAGVIQPGVEWQS